MSKVFIAHNPLEAHFVRTLLEREGIAAEVHGEVLFGLRPEIGIASDSLPSVWIFDDNRITRAREIVATYETRKTKTLK